MDALGAAAALITLAALFSWLNYKFIRRPPSIALLFFSLALSLALLGLSWLGIDTGRFAGQILDAIELDRVLLDSLLSFILFAGALHVDLGDVRRSKWAIGFLATLGVIISALLAGSAMWWIFGWLGAGIPFVWCLLFGALISPTDPIAVLAILKSASAEKTLEIKIAGESMLNDGVGIVLFVGLLGVVSGGEALTVPKFALLFAREAAGGALLGFALGWVCYRLLASVDDYQVEILLTLALVMGGYATALAIHVSGPIAIVVAGVLIGNHGRAYAMSERTRRRLDEFWELVDEILNAVLFVLVGLELLVIDFQPTYLWGAALAIPAVLAARFLSVGVATLVPGLRREFPPRVVGILTWGGLRGGISVALALALPDDIYRDALITATYGVVVFSILVQGLTLPRVVRWSGSGRT